MTKIITDSQKVAEIRHAVSFWVSQGFYVPTYTAEDVVQEVFCKLLERGAFSKYDESRGSFSNFIKTAVKRIMRDISAKVEYKISSLSLDVKTVNQAGGACCRLVDTIPDTRQVINGEKLSLEFALDKIKSTLIKGFSVVDLYNDFIVNEITVRKFAELNGVSKSTASNIKQALGIELKSLVLS